MSGLFTGTLGRGRIYWLDPGDHTKGHEQFGPRPCIDVTTDRLNFDELRLVVPCSTGQLGRRSRRYHPRLDLVLEYGAPPETTEALCEQLRVTSTERLTEIYGARITDDQLALVLNGVEMVLGLHAL